MSKILRVHLIAPSPDLVHQFRNFGEDIYRTLRDECYVSIDEIDASTSEFYLRGIHKRDARRMAAKVRKIAEMNLMMQIINVSECDEKTV